ncbi:hypothetical protein D1012_02750 [Pseudotabrizicola alkalilacus]|uniref:Uncharacterized protein n=1 Tax=Pseudotabrizicola alkalilacus TaxID=2305252 RepID=A0A411Z7E9_9RHOB|nr:hypothetical protein D1012_02750 [Pseudotabrizicola alkalilacus]
MRIKWRGVLLAEYGLPAGGNFPVTAILTSLAGAGVGTLIVEVEFGMSLGGATMLVGEFKR